MPKNNKKYLNSRGAMALSSILALSVILLALGIAMAFSGFVQNDMAHNQDKAAMAFYIAEAGVKDAIQKVVRNSKYSNVGYALSFPNGSANISVCHNDDIIVCPGAGLAQTEVISTGVSGANTKKIKVILNTDASGGGKGKVAIISWQEVGN